MRMAGATNFQSHEGKRKSCFTVMGYFENAESGYEKSYFLLKISNSAFQEFSRRSARELRRSTETAYLS
jgi:hypothetical protein